MLRDDGEARRQRVEALERDLAAAVREADELRARAEHASRLEEERVSLRREIEKLRAAWTPVVAARRRITMIAAAVALSVIAITGIYAANEITRVRREMALVRRDTQHQIDDVRQREAAERRELLARTREIVEGARLGEARAWLPEPPQPTPSERTFAPITVESRRVTVRGRRDLPRRCTAWISPQAGECRARVVCGEREIYPAPGDAGAFGCEVRDGRFAFGVDPDGTAADGDPRLLVRGDEGVIAVSDGPEQEWSVAIESAPF